MKKFTSTYCRAFEIAAGATDVLLSIQTAGRGRDIYLTHAMAKGLATGLAMAVESIEAACGEIRTIDEMEEMMRADVAAKKAAGE